MSTPRSPLVEASHTLGIAILVAASFLIGVGGGILLGGLIDSAVDSKPAPLKVEPCTTLESSGD